MDASAQEPWPTLLVLPGALGVADGGGEAIGLLAQRRRVITFSYGDERQIEALLARALAALEGEARFDVIGFSVGGWLAQCLAAREPERVRRIVLAHSFALEAGDAWRFALAARLWRLLPRPWFRAAVRKRAALALRALAARDPERRAATLERLHSALDRPETAAMLEAQQHVLRDSLRGGGCVAPGPVLIVEGADDPILGPAARDRLGRKYPRADRVVLGGVGHAGALVDPEGFAAAVDAFLCAKR